MNTTYILFRNNDTEIKYIIRSEQILNLELNETFNKDYELN